MDATGADSVIPFSNQINGYYLSDWLPSSTSYSVTANIPDNTLGVALFVQANGGAALGRFILNGDSEVESLTIARTITYYVDWENKKLYTKLSSSGSIEYKFLIITSN